jgi:pyruvate/2-oxoglutarate dehydrogenase complex dihydrolipoamide acyltransferase (E2) component
MRIAKQDTHAYDGVGVRRFVRAGDPLPPGLEPADPDQFYVREEPGRTGPAGALTGTTASTAELPPDPEPLPPPYDGHTVEDLEREVARRMAGGRDITVEGTGSGGNVVKDDLVAALEADDEDDDPAA